MTPRRNIGVTNPNSRNRIRRRDEDLSPVDLPEIDRARIAVESLELALHGIPAGFDDFHSEVEAKLKTARIKLAELETLPHRPNEYTACLDDDETLAHIDALVGTERLTIMDMIDAAELPFEFEDGTHPSPQIVGVDVVEFNSAAWFDSIEPVEF